MNKRKNKIIVCLCLIVFMLSVSSLSTLNYTNFNGDTDLETSDTNYLFNSKNYTFNLDDFYDDSILNKNFTGAEFQTEWFNDTELAWSGTYDNDTVLPVNNTIDKSPSLGDYPATYSFDDQPVGTSGIDVNLITYTSENISAIIIDEKDGHDTVLHTTLTDPNENWRYDYAAKTTGIIEYWFYGGVPDGGWDNGMYLMGGDCLFTIADGTLYFYNPTLGSIQVTSYSLEGAWHHIKWDFDLDNDFIKIYVNNVLEYTATSVGASTTYFRVYQYSIAEECWIDGFGVSWDPEYTPSDHHPGTYTFTNDPNGSAPDDWTGNTANYEVNDSYLDHNKNLAAIGDGVGGRSLVQNLGGWKTEGIIEWWWNLNAYSHSYVILNLKNDTDTMSHRMIAYGLIPYVSCDNGGFLYPSASGWHHYKVEFDCATNLISYWMDDVLLLEDKGFRSDFEPDYITSLQLLFSAGVPVGEKVYWDAFGYYPWDPYYTIGDNLLPSTGNTIPVELNMIDGSFDYTNNMGANDDINTNFISTTDSPDRHEMPVQWTDFSYTYGTDGGTAGTGSTEYNDAVNYAYMNAASYVSDGAETYLGYMVPATSDILTQWNDAGGDAPPHFSKLDEYTATPDGGNIREMSTSANDRWNFDNDLTIPADSVVTRLIVYIYGLHETTAQPRISIEMTSNVGVSGWYSGGNGGYVWQSDSTSGLSLNQAQLDALYINVSPYNSGYGDYCYVDIESVYINVYYTTSNTYYRHLSEITWDYSGANLDEISTFYYDYATTVATDCDLDIYDWVGTDFDKELESNTGTGYITGDFDLTSDGGIYVSGSNQIRVRFETAQTSLVDFDVRLDQLMFNYFLIDDHSAELNYTIDISFSEVLLEDLLAIEVSSHHYTNVSTTIDANIYNYDTSLYVSMFSTSVTAEAHHYFMNDTIPLDFLSDAGNLRLRFNGTNHISAFNMTVDYINITFYYKLDLEHSKAFAINGVYRYRWEITGSIHYTQWVIFEVVDPEPNFQAISESDYLTRWILQNSTLSPIVKFSDDISTNVWILEVGSASSFTELTDLTDDCYVNDNSPTNPHDGTGLKISSSYYSDEYRTLVGVTPSDYLTANASTNTTLQLYQYFDAGANMYIEVYETGFFDETTATWNNQPATGSYLDKTLVNTANGYKTIDIGEEFNTYYILYGDTIDAYRSYWDMEHGSTMPIITNSLNKDFFGLGYTYMQTDTTETIALRSIDYTTHYNLSSGDYFQVDFQTSSDSQINLILLKDGVVNKTLTLSQSGNTNFNNQTIKISTDEFVEFDQLKISSIFEDTDNIKVYDIKTYKYEIAGDSADFYVGSKRDYEVYLTPDIYNLRIIESDIEVINENITIPETGIRQYVYTPEPPISKTECRLTLFPIDGILSLNFPDYKTYVNRSYNGEYNEIPLVEPIFYADELTIVYISVYDRFDSLIGIFPEPIDDFINLEIEVYELEIINLMTEKTTIDINTTLYESELASERWVDFMLSEAEYVIGYYDTNDVYKQFTIYLNSNQVYELNRSKICFLSYADQQGNHLSFDNYRTYINGSMIYEQMFYREIGDSINITVNDRYNISIHSEIYDVISGDNYIPITLTMYSLKVMSQQLVFNHVNITRDSDYYDSDMYWSEWVAPGEIIDFRLFAGYYTINVTNVEDSSFSLYDYTLNGDDVILISSENTLYNVLYNIANVNATIGNQITNVEINITNQNSAINNTVINIQINLDNINSSLGTILVDIDTAISNINTSIINEIISLGTVINNINTSIINQILDIGVNITNMNSSIISQLLTLGVDISNINGSIIEQIITLGVDVTNINTTLYNQMLSIGVDITNLDTSITNQITSVISNITNVNTTILAQISSLSSDIINVNSTIISQFVSLGVDITNINTSLSNQILSLEVDITNINSSIIEQILLVIADIENIETVIDEQTLVILSDITNVNSTILNQMALLGLNITNVNATITNQILSLSIDLTNINASISNLLYYMDIDITTIMSNITSFYSFTNTSFINLNNVMNTSFINIESNIFTINTSISNLVIGVSSDIYLINGTISTMISSLENNLLLMNVSIDTSLFNLNTTINLIGSNITANYILLNNTLNLIDTNINDSRIAMINNLLLVNNTISTMIADVYSAVYLINNSIYTAMVDLGTYLSLVNNTISGNLSIVLQMNEFLTEIYQMTMFSELLNWTDIGLNTTLLTSQIDAWDFINHYKNQSVTILLRYNDLIDNLTVSAQNTIDQYLPNTGVEYREWSEELQDYVGEWQPLPENRTVNFGFFEADIPTDPEPIVNTFITYLIVIIFLVGISFAAFKLYYGAKEKKTEVPAELVNLTVQSHKKKIDGVVDDRL